MPVYCYRCPEGHPFEKRLSLQAPERTLMEQPCPRCKKKGRRDLAAESAHGGSDLRPYYSVAMGSSNPATQLPGEKYRPDGRVLVRDKEHRRRLMARLGFVDHASYTGGK